MNDIIIQVELSEFRERVYHALPVFPDTISLPDLTRKIYKTYDGKKDKYRRSHVMKAMNDLWRLKIAGHTLDKVGERWSHPKYYRKATKVRISRKRR